MSFEFAYTNVNDDFTSHRSTTLSIIFHHMSIRGWKSKTAFHEEILSMRPDGIPISISLDFDTESILGITLHIFCQQSSRNCGTLSQTISTSEVRSTSIFVTPPNINIQPAWK